MFLNVYAGGWYVADYFTPQRYALARWLQETIASGERLAVIEVGAGFNTPGVVRLPMESIVRQTPAPP